MVFHLQLAGYILLLLSLIHVAFPSYFRWKAELKDLSLINRQIMYVHTFFLAFIVLQMGLLCILCSHELIYTSLGKKISLGLSTFWFLRLLFQFFIYSPQLWKGKRFETGVHILFIVLWTYFSTLFFLAYIS